MSGKKEIKPDDGRVDYSDVTPATGFDPDDKRLPGTLANHMPTADTVAITHSKRADPDKTIPGGEAASSVDANAEARLKTGCPHCR